MFRQRTWLPLPLAAVLALVRRGEAPASALLLVGVLVVILGELIRIWAVRHIGAISRTRADRLGPVVSTGPFRLVRNPLYLGNIALWTGFALSARLPWMVPVVVVLLGLQYHAIVRWEEGTLKAQRGHEYAEYEARVPRWIPRWVNSQGRAPAGRFTWRETLFSERGTLAAIAAGYALLWLKHWWPPGPGPGP